MKDFIRSRAQLALAANSEANESADIKDWSLETISYEFIYNDRKMSSDIMQVDNLLERLLEYHSPSKIAIFEESFFWIGIILSFSGWLLKNRLTP